MSVPLIGEPLNFEALGDFILIEPIPQTVTPGGLALPETVTQTTPRGKVVAAGPGRRSENTGELIPCDVRAGDEVYLFLYGQPANIMLSGKEYMLCRSREVVGKVSRTS